jgi:hypothetical protein
MPAPPPRGGRHAVNPSDAIREVHDAIEIYSAALPDTMSPGGAADDEIPF